MNSDAFLEALIERIARETAARISELVPQRPAPQSASPSASLYLRTKDAARLLGLSVATLEAWRLKGKGPRATKLGNAVRYSREELDRWLASHTKGGAR
jgi:excisionase family DNA binding protein